jgi:hypothetical protein
VYFGDEDILQEASEIDLTQAYNRLKYIRGKIEEVVDDRFPYYRATYLKNLLDSILTQVDLFYFNSNEVNMSFKEVIEKLYGFTVPPSIDTTKYRNILMDEISEDGFTSLKDYYHNQDTLYIQQFSEIDSYLHHHLHGLTGRFKKVYKDHFGKIDIDKILELSKIDVIKAEEGMPSCYYYYSGNYHGTMAVALQQEYSERRVNSLIAHEIFPGHHFYYLVKEYLYNNQFIDMGVTLDTFISPEVVINEGLAMAVDVLFFDVVDRKAKINGLLEKYIHQNLYNIWHARYISHESYERYLEVLSDEIGLPDEKIKELTAYYLGDLWKYYTVSYAMGSYYVDRFINECGRENVHYLYSQHSVQTLNKLHRHIVSKRG